LRIKPVFDTYYGSDVLSVDHTASCASLVVTTHQMPYWMPLGTITRHGPYQNLHNLNTSDTLESKVDTVIRSNPDFVSNALTYGTKLTRGYQYGLLFASLILNRDHPQA
jgi:hypothetical protein